MMLMMVIQQGEFVNCPSLLLGHFLAHAGSKAGAGSSGKLGTVSSPLVPRLSWDSRGSPRHKPIHGLQSQSQPATGEPASEQPMDKCKNPMSQTGRLLNDLKRCPSSL